MKISTIESLIGMSLAELEAMSDTQIQDYLAEALKVQPPIKAGKVIKETTSRSLAVAEVKKNLSQSEQLAAMARQMGMKIVDGKLVSQ